MISRRGRQLPERKKTPMELKKIWPAKRRLEFSNADPLQHVFKSCVGVAICLCFWL